MPKIEVTDQCRSPYSGEIEFIIKDRNGNIIDRIVDHNIVKIFAKEILAHRGGHSRVWDPEASSGVGAWVDSGVDPDEEFSIKYIFFGASFDENGVPLDVEDPRYYEEDAVTGFFVPIRLEPSAEFEGGLINAVPISEPTRPLKKVESIDFEPTYQPSGTPLLQDDVRPMNNIVVYETTLEVDEYNGLGLSESDFFTITEVALSAGREIDILGDCEKTPREIFLEGSEGTAGSEPLAVIASGGDVVSIDPSESNVDLIKEGDQVKLVASGTGDLDLVNPFFLVLSKLGTGRDIQLDRVPVDSEGNPITGDIGLLRDTLRIFSHRILNTPVKKSSDFEIVVRWRIIYN